MALERLKAQRQFVGHTPAFRGQAAIDCRLLLPVSGRACPPLAVAGSLSSSNLANVATDCLTIFCIADQKNPEDISSILETNGISRLSASPLILKHNPGSYRKHCMSSTSILSGRGIPFIVARCSVSKQALRGKGFDSIVLITLRVMSSKKHQTTISRTPLDCVFGNKSANIPGLPAAILKFVGPSRSAADSAARVVRLEVRTGTPRRLFLEQLPHALRADRLPIDAEVAD